MIIIGGSMKKLVVFLLPFFYLSASGMAAEKEKRKEVQKIVKTRFHHFMNKSTFPFNESDQADYKMIKQMGLFVCQDILYTIGDELFRANMLLGVCNNLEDKVNIATLTNEIIAPLEKDKKETRERAERLNSEITDTYDLEIFKIKIETILRLRKIY